jgi:hypothetical protein
MFGCGRLPDLHSVETQTPPHQRRKQTTPVRPLLPTPSQQHGHNSNNGSNNAAAAVPTSQVKSGPNGNYIVYEREFNGPGGGGSGNRASPANRPLPNSPPRQDYGNGIHEPTYGETGGNMHHHHIYSQPSSSIYGGVTPSAKPPPPAYSLAPPYRPKDSLMTATPQRSLGAVSSPVPQRPALVTSPKNGGGHNASLVTSPQKQVHFAASPRSAAGDDESTLLMSPSSPVRRAGYANNGRGGSHSDSSSSSGQSSSLSGPSSLDSVLYDDSLVVIEKSNQELELRLSSGRSAAPMMPTAATNGGNSNGVAFRTQLSRNRIDTIHNNRHLDQEVIYEDNSSLASSSRSSSQSTLKPDGSIAPPDHPSLSDLGSILDLSAKFQSLTARKLIAGLSISSIDTLLEVNTAAAADADSKNNNNSNSNNGHRCNQLLDESTETIDFGVI